MICNIDALPREPACTVSQKNNFNSFELSFEDFCPEVPQQQLHRQVLIATLSRSNYKKSELLTLTLWYQVQPQNPDTFAAKINNLGSAGQPDLTILHPHLSTLLCAEIAHWFLYYGSTCQNLCTPAFGQRSLPHQNAGPQLHRTSNFSLQCVIFNAVVKRQCRYQTSIALLGNPSVPTPGLCFPPQVFFPCSGEVFGAQAPFFGFILHYSHCGHWWEHGLEEWEFGTSVPDPITHSGHNLRCFVCSHTGEIKVWKVRGICHGQLSTHCTHSQGLGMNILGRKKDSPQYCCLKLEPDFSLKKRVYSWIQSKAHLSQWKGVRKQKSITFQESHFSKKMENISAKQNLHLQTNCFHQFQAY